MTRERTVVALEAIVLKSTFFVKLKSIKLWPKFDGDADGTGCLLSANHLVAVVLGGQDSERGLNGDTTTETEHQVERGLLLDVVVGQRAAVLELLAGEDQTLLIRRDALLVLDLGLDILDGVRRLDLQGDGLTS